MVKYLKSLYLQGFKSFPVKTEIELVEGITGIVGSNGSGKSNIVEAIKWVLGEQSAKSLRGDKMEDVIFNGTRDRSPMGMAEVNLVFDNENHWLPIDYSEVSVSRRMFRSGEGQYSINKSRVRLKDVVELFLDTGVGRDSYAIFEQGKIDRLLSESAVERRALFEDFAGISKFKYRKEEAEKKLENTRTNLERINDIIIELEKETISLKEQADNANRYQEIKLNLTNGELKFEALRKLSFEKEIENKLAQKETQNKKLIPLKQDVMGKEDQIVKFEENIQEEETAFNRLHDEYALIEREYGELKARLENNIERKSSTERQIINMQNRLKEGEERKKVLEIEHKDKEKELDSISGNKEEVSERMRIIQVKIDDIHKELALLDDNIRTASKDIGFDRIITRDQVEKNKGEIIALQTRLESLRATLQEKWNHMRVLEKEENEREAQLEIAGQSLASLTEELKKALNEIETLQEKEKALRKENAQLNENMKMIQEESREIDRMIIASLEKQAALLKEFSIKKPDMEAEIDRIFSELIDMVKQNRPVEEIKSKVISVRDFFAVYMDNYEGILNVLYSEGGTYTKKESQIRKIEEIGINITKNDEEIEKTRGLLKATQEIREGIQNNYNRSQYDSSSLTNEIKKVNIEKTADQEVLKTIENQINDTSVKIKSRQNVTESMIKIIDGYEEKMLNIKANRNSLFEELNGKKVEHARVDEKYKSLSNEVSRIKNQLSDLEKMKDTYESDKNNANINIADLQEKIKNDDAELVKLTDLKQVRKNEIDHKKDLIDGMHKSKKTIENQRKLMEENIQKLEKIIINLDNSISERKGILSSLIDNVLKNHNVDINTVKTGEEDNFETISAEINEFRNELQRLGNVNLLAIEQYQNAKEKLEFLMVQKEDIEKAMSDIINLIEETNKKCIEQFTSSFEDIRKGFKKIFSRLFDGGRADLMLEDDNDVLNSGVNIFAEPPGKKFQSISLLSGGERALVAIAVIFAILYLKPTPFVVLDEMDAPLDDDNIERFKALLQDFRETSQFIIVSHSKSTLEICNALYGVTMEEQGVSKIVNVEFDEAQVLFKAAEQKPAD